MNDVQTSCCRCASKLACICPQGFGSHALAEGEPECDCGQRKLAEEPWQNCSGMTHVFHEGERTCSCRQKTTAVSPA